MGRVSYLLDSNILSEPARLKPDKKVLQQLADHDGDYATAAIVWHELVYGCELLTVSKRKKQLQSYLEMLLVNGLIVLPYDQAAADWYAKENGPDYNGKEKLALMPMMKLLQLLLLKI
ncbi:MAG: PIN domain-containing protein [Methylococcaceae bacterium]